LSRSGELFPRQQTGWGTCTSLHRLYTLTAFSLDCELDERLCDHYEAANGLQMKATTSNLTATDSMIMPLDRGKLSNGYERSSSFIKDLH
jgi:hypothetical protein